MDKSMGAERRSLELTTRQAVPRKPHLRVARVGVVLGAASLLAASLGCTGSIEDTGPGQAALPPGAVPPDNTGVANPPVTSPPPATLPEGCNYTHARVWRLTHTQLKNTLQSVFGATGTTVDRLPDDQRVEGYSNAAESLHVPSLLADNYFRVSDEVAVDVVARASEFTDCPIDLPGQTACLASFITEYGLKAWRRPVTDIELQKLSQLHLTAETQADPQVAFRTLVQALILSPNFLFRTELGSNPAPGTASTLTNYELAQALSYTLWDEPPDDQLLQLAAQGVLAQPDQLLAQAQRLWSNTEKAAPAINRFFSQWMRLGRLDNAGPDYKDTEQFDAFSPQLVADYVGETQQLIREVMFDGGDGTVTSLLTATHGYVTERSAEVYGVDRDAAAPNASDPNELVRVELDPTERRGVLTQGSFLTANSSSDDTGPVGRGTFLRETLLCDKVLPPPAVPIDMALFADEDRTWREKLEVHRMAPACASCHALFDPMGLAMENFDPIGRYRSVDKGQQIDATGSVPLPNQGPIVPFNNFVDMVDKLSQEPYVYECFATQFMMYATGQQEKHLDTCSVEQAAGAFSASGYKLNDLMMTIVNQPGFTTRVNGE